MFINFKKFFGKAEQPEKCKNEAKNDDWFNVGTSFKELLDGLTIDEIALKYSFLLRAEIKDVVLGRLPNGRLVWHSGEWVNGRITMQEISNIDIIHMTTGELMII